MSENSGTVNNEKSFFDDKSYYNIESSKKSQNDSSNPEKEYNLLNKEINKYTAEGDKGDTRFSNDNSEITLSEHIFDSKIWKKDQSVHKKDDSYSSKNK